MCCVYYLLPIIWVVSVGAINQYKVYIYPNTSTIYYIPHEELNFSCISWNSSEDFLIVLWIEQGKSYRAYQNTRSTSIENYAIELTKKENNSHVFCRRYLNRNTDYISEKITLLLNETEADQKCEISKLYYICGGITIGLIILSICVVICILKRRNHGDRSEFCHTSEQNSQRNMYFQMNSNEKELRELKLCSVCQTLTTQEKDGTFYVNTIANKRENIKDDELYEYVS